MGKWNQWDPRQQERARFQAGVARHLIHEELVIALKKLNYNHEQLKETIGTPRSIPQRWRTTDPLIWEIKDPVARFERRLRLAAEQKTMETPMDLRKPNCGYVDYVGGFVHDLDWPEIRDAFRQGLYMALEGLPRDHFFEMAEIKRAPYFPFAVMFRRLVLGDVFADFDYSYKIKISAFQFTGSYQGRPTYEQEVAARRSCTCNDSEAG